MAQPYLIPLSNNKITTQQLLFIQNYISNGFNATQAAIDANYHSKSRDGIGKTIKFLTAGKRKGVKE